MKLSFIVITYKRRELLQQCLDSIYTQQGIPKPYEIIIIDNGGDAEIRPPDDPAIQVRLERTEQNLGSSAARNLAMQYASGDYFVFIDDDAIWHEPSDVARLIAHFETNLQCGAASARSLDPQGQLITVDLPHPNKSYISNVTTAIEIPYFYTVGLALRAKIVEQVGGYPEHYFHLMDEPDLSLRLVNAGYRIIYDPSVIVYHHRSKLGRATIGHNYWKTNAINKVRMAFRLLPYPYPLTTLFIWSVACLIKTRSPGLLGEICRTLWAERKKLLHDRNPIQPETIRYLKRIGARLLY
jgi:GT2 family glycosyltransferase